MILTGSQRGGARQLAAHLLSHENDHVTVHEVRGFATSDLTGAFVEAQAISKATKCRQFLFSLSLSPPPKAAVPTTAFEDAVKQIEQKLDLVGQPRAIVFHEKHGRRHAHVIWSRIDAESMKAKQMSFYKTKLREVSKTLFRAHGWVMPEGLADSTKRDPRNFTLHEWLQAKRAQQDPRDIKEALQDAWQISDSRDAYEQALGERGFKLARGDRRGFVAVDYEGSVFAVARWTGIKTKDVRARLGPESELPSIEQQQASFAEELAPRIEIHRKEAKAIRDQELAALEARRKAQVDRQSRERLKQREQQDKRAQTEQAARQSRYRKGLRGFVDRVTGRHARIKAVNELELFACLQRDQKERDDLIFKHIEARQKLESEKAEAMARYRMVERALLIEVSYESTSEETARLHQRRSANTFDIKVV